MLCSSFFWWPARVMPRPGRSLVGKEWIRLGPTSLVSQMHPLTWGPEGSPSHLADPAYSRLS